jgi:hypothetical protein
MPVPAGLSGPLADYLQSLEDRIAELENPNGPAAEFSCLKANLPDALTYLNRRAYVTDTKITVVSDGTVWRRQDTGAAI